MTDTNSSGFGAEEEAIWGLCKSAMGTGRAMSIFGYFDSPLQSEPFFDPGLGVNCPHCRQPLDAGPEDRLAICFMLPGDARSYFYRVHKVCHDTASPEAEMRIESWIVDKPVKVV